MRWITRIAVSLLVLTALTATGDQRVVTLPLQSRPADFTTEDAEALRAEGVLPDERLETADGLERTWATNVVGPFLLTWKLVPSLRRAAAGARAAGP